MIYHPSSFQQTFRKLANFPLKSLTKDFLHCVTLKVFHACLRYLLKFHNLSTLSLYTVQTVIILPLSLRLQLKKGVFLLSLIQMIIKAEAKIQLSHN